MIYHSSKDERGKYSGGQAGDQTGKEVCGREWYNRPWNVVMEPPSEALGITIAKKAKAAAENDNVGYDQGNRNSIIPALEEVDWKASKIKTKCECDCSSYATAIVIASSSEKTRETRRKILIQDGNCATTGTLRSRLKKIGFKEHTSSEYLKSDKKLGPGWILIYEGHHCAINYGL